MVDWFAAGALLRLNRKDLLLSCLQAVNNSDYAIGQFRFLVRLLLVHGSLSSYRLSRLIKYSFYKNISFAFVLFFYQFYNGFSGQALVDDISAAAFNVVFTSLPILLFAVLDRPVINFSSLIQYPQVGFATRCHCMCPAYDCCSSQCVCRNKV